MRPRLLWVALLAAAFAPSAGCMACGHSSLDGIPVRRLPDEVLHAPACAPGCETVVQAKKPGKIKQAQATVPILEEHGPAVPDPSCGSCAAVFYTGGVLGGGEYPLTGGLRVVEAVAVARGSAVSGPSRLTVLRRLPTGQQIPIRVDLDEALRDPRENIAVWPCDLIVLQETPCEAFCRCLGRVFHLGPKVAAHAATGCRLP